MSKGSAGASTARRQFLAFCLVGASGVAVNMAIFAGVLWVLPKDGLGPWTTQIASFPAWVISVATNFVLNDRVTFAAHDFHHGFAQRLWRYYLGAISGYLLQLAVLTATLWSVPAEWSSWPLESLLSWSAGRKLGANLAGICVGTVANFAMARLWVFRQRTAPSESRNPEP